MNARAFGGSRVVDVAFWNVSLNRSWGATLVPTENSIRPNILSRPPLLS